MGWGMKVGGGGAGGNKVLYSEGSILKGVRGCFLFFYEGLGDGGRGRVMQRFSSYFVNVKILNQRFDVVCLLGSLCIYTLKF